jgi:hypothetical protein
MARFINGYRPLGYFSNVWMTVLSPSVDHPDEDCGWGRLSLSPSQSMPIDHPT